MFVFPRQIHTTFSYNISLERDFKETKIMNRVVADTTKEALLEAIKHNDLLLMGQTSIDRFKKDNMETMKNVIKSIKEEMSEGFRLLSEATQENL